MIKNNLTKHAWFTNGILVTVLIALCANVIIHFREIFNQYIIYPDAFFKYIVFSSDLSLFKNDPFVQIVRCPFSFNIVSIETIPLVLLRNIYTVWFFLYTRLFYFFTKLFPLAHVLTMASICFNIIASVFVYKIARFFTASKENKEYAYFLVMIFLIYTATMDSFYAGMERGIGFVLTCALYFYACKRDVFKIMCCTFLSVFLYTAIFPAAFLLALMVFLLNRCDRPTFRKIFAISCYSIAIAWSVFFMIKVFSPSGHGFFQLSYMDWKYGLKLSSPDVIDLEYYKYIYAFVLNGNEHAPLYIAVTIGLIIINLLLLIIFFKNKHGCPGEQCFVAASISTFFILVPIHLALGSRQLIFSIPLCLMLFLWKHVLWYLPCKKFVFRSILITMAAVSVFFYAYASDVQDLTGYKNVYDYFLQSPKDSLICGHPEDVKFIPFYAQRSVYFNPAWSTSTCIANQKTKEEYRRRRERMVRIMYSRSLEELKTYIRQEGITHFFVNEYYYSNNYLLSEKEWHETFKLDIVNYTEVTKVNRDDFVVLSLAYKLGKQKGDGIFVFACAEILAL
ncbi:MAG: hypothetical protein K8S27_04575 [Candidatus Omnitrophica bacterium]|nr:hypothetical protein [Candidatus Omnitrophota bacterium]